MRVPWLLHKCITINVKAMSSVNLRKVQIYLIQSTLFSILTISSIRAYRQRLRYGDANGVYRIINNVLLTADISF